MAGNILWVREDGYFLADNAKLYKMVDHHSKSVYKSLEPDQSDVDWAYDKFPGWSANLMEVIMSFVLERRLAVNNVGYCYSRDGNNLFFYGRVNFDKLSKGDRLVPVVEAKDAFFYREIDRMYELQTLLSSRQRADIVDMVNQMLKERKMVDDAVRILFTLLRVDFSEVATDGFLGWVQNLFQSLKRLNDSKISVHSSQIPNIGDLLKASRNGELSQKLVEGHVLSLGLKSDELPSFMLNVQNNPVEINVSEWFDFDKFENDYCEKLLSAEQYLGKWHTNAGFSFELTNLTVCQGIANSHLTKCLTSNTMVIDFALAADTDASVKEFRQKKQERKQYRASKKINFTALDKSSGIYFDSFLKAARDKLVLAGFKKKYCMFDIKRIPTRPIWFGGDVFAMWNADTNCVLTADKRIYGYYISKGGPESTLVDVPAVDVVM